MTIDITKLRENVAKEHVGLWVDPTGIVLALCDELDQARELLEGTAEQHDETLKTCSHLTEKIADLEGKWQAAMNALVTVEEQRDQARADVLKVRDALAIDRKLMSGEDVLKQVDAYNDTEFYEQYR